MKVVHVATAFPRYADDPITPWLVELVRRQREAGIDASVLAPAYRGGPAEEPTDIPVHRFRYAPGSLETLTHDQSVPDRMRDRPVSAALVPAYLAAGRRAAAALGRKGVDLAHVHWPMPHALIGSAMRKASGGRTAMVCSYYSVEVNWVSHRLTWLRPFLEWTIRSADAVTAISNPTASAVRRLVDRPVAVIPYGAAMPDAKGLAGRPAFSDPEAPIRLLFVGRLVERKGVEVLVRALARVRHHRPAELVVVGSGTSTDEITRTAALEGVTDHVHMLGFVRPERLAHEYAECDVFVLPAVVDSRGDTEGLGVVLLEAMARERPVVASRAGGILDVVSDGVTGWLVEPGDAAVLAERILALAADPEETRRVAARGRQEVDIRFSWERILDETAGVYESARLSRREHRG